MWTCFSQKNRLLGTLFKAYLSIQHSVLASIVLICVPSLVCLFTVFHHFVADSINLCMSSCDYQYLWSVTSKTNEKSILTAKCMFRIISQILYHIRRDLTKKSKSRIKFMMPTAVFLT